MTRSRRGTWIGISPFLSFTYFVSWCLDKSFLPHIFGLPAQIHILSNSISYMENMLWSSLERRELCPISKIKTLFSSLIKFDWAISHFLCSSYKNHGLSVFHPYLYGWTHARPLSKGFSPLFWEKKIISNMSLGGNYWDNIFKCIHSPP